MQSEYTRVTEVLSYHSGLDKINRYVLQRAAERGEIVHQICDAIIEDIGTFIEPEYQGYIDSFEKWKEGKKFISKLPRLYCDKYMITGEIDQIYKDDNGLVLVDFKTPAKESKTWPLQGSAYAYLCSQNGYDITRIEFIQLFKNGELAKTYHYKENFEMFLKCLDVYRYFQPKENEEDYLQDI